MLYLHLQKQLFGSNGTMELDVTMQVKKGEFVALSGKSGSGKTTLLRIIAGLEKAKGSIKVGNEVWQSERLYKKIQHRSVGFVFQEYALFENMSVEQNLLYILNDKDLANRLLQITQLKPLAKHSVKTLSGGQKQRVALARAMMRKPKLLLLDEPFSALDANLRDSLQKELKTLHNEFNLTTIMVSHDPSEIYKLATKVYLLENGLIIKEGNAKEVLLKMSGSQKFSFAGEILELYKADVLHVGVVAIGQQLVEVVLSSEEVQNFYVGQKVLLSTKAFSPTIQPLET